MVWTFLLLAMGVSLAAGQKSDADVLAANMPAMELWSDARLKEIHAPYLNCYTMFIEGGTGSALKDDLAVRRLLEDSRSHCAGYKAGAVAAADIYLAKIRPNLTSAERGNLLANYRRQMGLFALAERYREQGRWEVFDKYMERLGREFKLGRRPVVLTSE